MSKYFWMPGYDGSVIYVKRIKKYRFFGERIKTVGYFYAAENPLTGYYWSYEGAVQQAKELVARLSELEVKEGDTGV